jgi:hypothetical protein
VQKIGVFVTRQRHLFLPNHPHQKKIKNNFIAKFKPNALSHT